MRLTPEDFARLQHAVALFLSAKAVPGISIPVTLLSKQPEICPQKPAVFAEFIYPQLTARDFSVRLQPYSLQSASRCIFKVHGFL
ncbi:hypothetical protein DP190_21120 [Enterobacter cloacae]|nr:hypothetical protein DP190_21120 [Enterobacter cloacae]